MADISSVGSPVNNSVWFCLMSSRWCAIPFSWSKKCSYSTTRWSVMDDARLSLLSLIWNDGSDIGDRLCWDIVDTPSNVGSSELAAPF